ncbi:MAG: GH32 C-terminal domain-containing protein, partial [Phycisphaerae bacterium]
LKLARGEALRLRIFIDASVVEVFANGRACMTSRVYPMGRGSVHAALFAEGGGARAGALEAWDLRP